MRRGIVLLTMLVGSWMFAVGCGTPLVIDSIPRAQIRLSSDQIPPTFPVWIRAFVETGGDDKDVLIALNTVTASEEHEIRVIGAAARTIEGKLGILITVWFEFEIPQDIFVAVTISQADAEFFGDPQLYTGL